LKKSNIMSMFDVQPTVPQQQYYSTSMPMHVYYTPTGDYLSSGQAVPLNYNQPYVYLPQPAYQ